MPCPFRQSDSLLPLGPNAPSTTCHTIPHPLSACTPTRPHHHPPRPARILSCCTHTCEPNTDCLEATRREPESTHGRRHRRRTDPSTPRQQKSRVGLYHIHAVPGGMQVPDGRADALQHERESSSSQSGQPRTTDRPAVDKTRPCACAPRCTTCRCRDDPHPPTLTVRLGHLHGLQPKASCGRAWPTLGAVAVAVTALEMRWSVGLTRPAR